MKSYTLTAQTVLDMYSSKEGIQMMKDKMYSNKVTDMKSAIDALSEGSAVEHITSDFRDIDFKYSGIIKKLDEKYIHVTGEEDTVVYYSKNSIRKEVKKIFKKHENEISKMISAWCYLYDLEDSRFKVNKLDIDIDVDVGSQYDFSYLIAYLFFKMGMGKDENIGKRDSDSFVAFSDFVLFSVLEPMVSKKYMDKKYTDKELVEIFAHDNQYFDNELSHCKQ